jgi:hypothetical protein
MKKYSSKIQVVMQVIMTTIKEINFKQRLLKIATLNIDWARKNLQEPQISQSV